MATRNTSNPQTSRREKFSPLEDLVQQVLRRAGDGSVGRARPETMLMMIEFANEVIEDLRVHPYWPDSPPDYYESQTDRRSIPDAIMTRGLLARYAEQQGKATVSMSMDQYYTFLNQILYQRLYGNEWQPELEIRDKNQRGYKKPATVREG